MSNVVIRRKPLKDLSWGGGESSSGQTHRSSSSTADERLRKTQKHLAALLPSKQNIAYATVRLRNQDERYRTRRFYHTVRGYLTIHGVSKDLERGLSLERQQSVDNEEMVQLNWDQIKELPVSMSEKREMNKKSHMIDASRKRNNFKWKRKKMLQSFNNRLSDLRSKLDFWERDMKKIEGNYGTGVVAYFVFIKWLTLLNFFIFLMLFFFIVLPEMISTPSSEISNCTLQYLSNMPSKSSAIEFMQNIVQGTGEMEYTLFFYGNYTNEIIKYSSSLTYGRMHYSLPLAYIFVILTVLVISLFAVVREASRGFKYKFHEGDEQFYQYCNLIFGGWDFCIDNESAAQMKKAVICNEIQACLDAERLTQEKKNRSGSERRKLIITRVVINAIQMAILGTCGFAIYKVFEKSTEMLDNDLESIERFFYEFFPSITTVSMNVVVPLVFKFLIVYERYSPNFTIFVLLGRTVFLRLSSIIVFYASMYNKIRQENFNSCTDCWETYIGQQIYRLAITDFAIHVLLTFFVNFPRSFLSKTYSENKIITFFGRQTFDLPKHVLDVVYTQTLCWLGAFYAPLLPAMFVAIFFFMFYIKKFACLVNSVPGSIINRTSKSKFMTILLLAYAVAVFPVAYTIGEISPSKSCGPFRDVSTMWEFVYDTFEKTPSLVRDIFQYIATAVVAIGIFIILIILIYYYVATINANNHMVRSLKAQLVLEGHDKQFLLDKIGYFMKLQDTDLRT